MSLPSDSVNESTAGGVSGSVRDEPRQPPVSMVDVIAEELVRHKCTPRAFGVRLWGWDCWCGAVRDEANPIVIDDGVNLVSAIRASKTRHVAEAVATALASWPVDGQSSPTKTAETRRHLMGGES